MKCRAFAFGWTLLATVLSGATPVNPARNTTTLVMGRDFANGIIPAAGPSRVSVPPGEAVWMTLLAKPSVPIQWTKDGKAIPGATTETYVISYATTADVGSYSVTGLTFPEVATGIDLNVASPGNVTNVSARVTLQPSGSQIVGFVVSGTKPKNLLFRAVGPTLAKFGIASPAPQPRVHCYDAQGHEVTFPDVAVVTDVNALFESVGAFAIDDSELPTISFDDGPFAPGSYTLVVDDAAKTGGTALVEVYEMPN